MDELSVRSLLLSMVHVRTLPLHQAGGRVALQVHLQRKALHKEHEELFESEVEKLVEIN